MAKVTAPLQSFSASGKIGKSLVFFPHLGRNVVRGLVTPANPMTPGQGSNRLLLGALGRSMRAVNYLSEYVVDSKVVVPAGQTYVSNYIKRIIENFGSGSAGVTAFLAAFSGHTADAIFESEAVALGLSAVTIPYADTTTTIPAGAQLYALAVMAFLIKASNPDLFDRAPYTVALASWDSGDIASFVTDITTAA